VTLEPGVVGTARARALATSWAAAALVTRDGEDKVATMWGKR
jgi:hypothetical protein